MREKYGHYWPDTANDITIELAAFKRGITEEQGGLGKLKHYQNVVDALWNREDSIQKFDWNPWAMKMLTAACQHRYLAVAGCASSSKTDTFVLWGLVQYIADPLNTTVLLTSTSLKDSRIRGWGRMMKYSRAVPGLPGKPVDSLGMIKYLDQSTGDSSTDSGIFLIAGDQSHEAEAIGKMIGFKNRTIIVIADELCELSPAILKAAESNLEAGAASEFQFIGLSNPASYYDPFGVLAKPKAGWGSITADSTEWETERGYCLRLDAELSPNVLAGEKLYPYMIDKDELEKKRASLGENSPEYWRMYRGFWSPTGNSSGLYTEQDIMQNGAEERDVKWEGEPTRCAFLDTAFTDGNDRAVVQFGKCGKAKDGRVVLLLDDGYEILKPDITKKTVPINFQIAEAFRDTCLKNGVRIIHAGVDASASGAAFGDILASVWGTGFYRCQFGGAPSERRASASDDRTCREAYSNRVSEIWGMGVELLRTAQLRGLYFDLIQELTARLFTTHKKGDGLCIEVETKKKMRGRTGKSPDIADAALGLVDLCRERLGLDSVQGESLSFGDGGPHPWEHLLKRSDEAFGGSPEDADGLETEQISRFFSSNGFIPMWD